MHNTMIAPEIRARYTKLKGGREFAFNEINPSKTAHLIVDMQNGFMLEGTLLEVPTARSVVKNINAITHALRENGGLNIFLRFTTTTASEWSVYFENFQAENFSKAQVEAFSKDSHLHNLYAELDIQAHDLIVDKTRFSPFTQGSSNALEILKEKGIDTVLISGTLTNCCCEATARDAQQLGFRVIFICDANAALSDYEHNTSINSLAALFADIRTTQQTVGLIFGEKAA
ncbi:cysteine hydrolase family protein [Acinetobacter sp. ANC 3781]|uniref:cysteine hydrolase family protein n=1 Tax=Acinetobacter sp. ANC 3781 TaxID=2529835 RepID=UPI00103A0E04|nr:cysteine hydrolase [Acinetobacter sp. ANC 3781]TCB70846.1 cysteine hydrolase [Acinetobacter sp. ANC 3781]